MTQWEYLTTPLMIHTTQAILNNWGSDGWELVHAGMRAHRHDLRPLNAPRASTMATKGEL